MAFVIADRVRETTTTTGTGTITLAGAVANFETFTANLSNSDTTYYAIVDSTNNAFEVGLGTFTSSGTTLARSVIASSNSNNLVDFGVGTKDVFITIPASKMVVEDGSNNVAIGGTVTATGFSGSGANLTALNVSTDSTPQLGGNLDTNSHNILIDNDHFIADESGNEQIIFNTTSSAVNQFEVTNSATSTAFTQGPHLSVSGGDSEIDLNLAAKGAGHIVIKGNTNPGAIRFNCESNSHGQTLIGAAHSAGATNTLVLPTDAGTLVGTGDTGTVTNAMLAGSIAASKLAGSIGDTKLSTITTAGKVELGALEIDGASEMGAALADADLLIVDDGAGGTEKSMLASRIPTYVFSKVSGDATVASNGALTIAAQAVENSMLADDAVGADELAANAVVNASVASGAAIAFSKMENLTASRALVSDGSGDVSAATTTSTEIGYVNGVTSAIQTQLDAKATKGFATAMAIAL